MEPDAIDAVLRGLRPYRWGWRLDSLPRFSFLGKPVALHVDTQPIPTGNPSPPLDATEIELVRLILGGLPGVLAEAERQYRQYNADFPDLIERAHEPRIWLSRDILADEGPLHWAFVVGIVDAPDWGIHSEFEGLEFRRIWSGD